MTWDYLQDEYEPSEAPHYWSSGRWQTIDVELEAQKRTISLTRKEWRQLNGFLSKYEFDHVKPHHFEHLSDNLQIIIRDWTRDHP